MSRCLGFVVCVCLIACSLAEAQDHSPNIREWFAKDGRRIEGALLSVDLERDDPKVSIQLNGGKTKEFDLKLLSEPDQNFVRLQESIAQDRDQFELIAEHIEALRSTPKAVAGTLGQLAKNFPLSPYANVWGCIAVAAGDNKPKDANKLGQQAISRIREQRELDASRHPRTLSAALNNCGVCYIKLRDGDRAAKQFVMALEELDYVPPILAHNINHLLEMKESPGGLRLERDSVILLESSMAGRRVLEPKKKMQPGWYYSLDLDTPQVAKYRGQPTCSTVNPLVSAGFPAQPILPIRLIYCNHSC